MTIRRPSFPFLESRQQHWASGRSLDSTRPTYMATLAGNLFGGRLSPETCGELRSGDGSELEDTQTRPAKMRALLSSSALAVNFFDPWRAGHLGDLSRALGFDGLAALSFEYKPPNYPVGPRSPNLDLLLTLTGGTMVGVECKFAEPFRSSSKSALAPKYFPGQPGLWAAAGLPGCQAVADGRCADYNLLDAAQLVKHMLGLAHGRASQLLYLWFDTGLQDARSHREETDDFLETVRGDRISFRHLTYQEIFDALNPAVEPLAGWRRYMQERYFDAPEAG